MKLIQRGIESARFRSAAAWRRFSYGIYYAVADGAIGRFVAPPKVNCLKRYVGGLQLHPALRRIQDGRSISMLHDEVLALLYHLVAISPGRVLEIGTYVGGATVVMTWAANTFSRLPIISIEPGGRSDHPTLASEDIYGDLLRNLAQLGCVDATIVHHGFSTSPDILAAVGHTIGSSGLGLVVIDADGHVERDIPAYRKFFRDGTVLVLDDYSAPGAQEKACLVKDWVDAAIASGLVQSLGVWGWGTWIGIYRGDRA